jgi:hypothetical protein
MKSDQRGKDEASFREIIRKLKWELKCEKQVKSSNITKILEHIAECIINLTNTR